MARYVRRAWVVFVLLASLSVSAYAGAQQAADGVSLNTPQVWHVWPKDSPDKAGRIGSPLAMELSRQAILIAAREELGLRTLDPSLGEPAELIGVLSLNLGLEVVWQEGSHLTLSLGDKELYRGTIDVPWRDERDLIAAVSQHEQASRGVFVQALGKAGLKGEPSAWHDSAPVPEDTLALSNHFALTQQFRAARALHQLVDEQGGSPERLWALSRVYANLAQECRWFIRCQFAVFQARSLLYAQRLHAKSPDHELGRLSLAYAWTLAGYPAWADEHLRALEAGLKAGGQDDPPSWAEWVPLLRACYAYDQPALDTIMADGGPAAAVAALWTAHTNEFAGMSGLTFDAIDKAVKANPLSSRNLYAGYEQMGVSTGHWLTEAAPKHFGSVTGQLLMLIEDAPPAVTERLAELDGRPMSLRDLAALGWALQDLTAAGKDDAEFTYGVLGTLIDEANALHVLYRAKFMRNQWGVDTSAYLRQSLPALDRHPFQPLLLTFIFPRNNQSDGMREAMSRFEPGYINPYNLSTFLWQTPNAFTYADGMSENDWWAKAVEMDIRSNSDYLVGMRWRHGENLHTRGEEARRMRASDPHHPTRIALRLRHSDLPADQFNKLVAEYGRHAVVANALAERMELDGNIEAAREYAATASPERRTVERQARLELLIGNEDRWLTVMESILELPDHGLDHARINNIIARTLMNQDRYKDALPYAEAAAGSWAAWAMRTYLLPDLPDGAGAVR